MTGSLQHNSVVKETKFWCEFRARIKTRRGTDAVPEKCELQTRERSTGQRACYEMLKRDVLDQIGQERTQGALEDMSGERIIIAGGSGFLKTAVANRLKEVRQARV